MIVCESGSGIIKISQDDGIILSGLSVLPDHRGKGIGTSLVREAERIVKEEIGANEDITLSVKSWNKELIGWYTIRSWDFAFMIMTAIIHTLLWLRERLRNSVIVEIEVLYGVMSFSYFLK